MLIDCAAYQDGRRLGAFSIRDTITTVISVNLSMVNLHENIVMAGIDLYLYFRFKKIKWL